MRDRPEILNLVLYGLISAMAFLINPFLFFYYEDKQEEDRHFASVRRQWQNEVDRTFFFSPLSAFNLL